MSAESNNHHQIPDADTGGAHETRPIPPRYWWLKRILLVGGIFAVGLIGLRIWWGCEAERRLQAAIDKYRAAGQPVLLEDFAVEPIPDEDNAAHFLTQAAAKLTQPADVRFSVENFLKDRQLLTDQADQLAQLIQANQETLDLIRTARSKTAVDWKIKLASPMINLLVPMLSPQRQMAKLTSLMARYHHQAGNDAAAIESLRDTLAIGNYTARGNPTLIAHLVRVAIEALAIYEIESIAPTLRVVESPAQEHTNGQNATRAQVQALISELLEEESLRRGWVWSMYGERLMQLDATQCILQGRINPIGQGMVAGTSTLQGQVIGLILGPAWKLDAIRMMKHTTDITEAGAAPNWPVAQTLQPTLPEPYSGVDTVVRTMSLILIPSLERSVLLQFRAYTIRRMAATALAIRLYEIDHGHRPATLSELVPEYLMAVPRDPFAADEREIGYASNAETPVLYSVGPNGVDEGGSIGFKSSGWLDWEAKDIPFFLNGDRPQANWNRPTTNASDSPVETQPTSLQAGPDNQQVEDDQGESED